MVLSKDQIIQELANLDGWELEGSVITKKFSRDDFSHSLDFVTHVGDLSEEHDHHPDIEIRYNEVKLTLSTHSEGGVTDKDIELAREIETVAP